MTVAAPTVASSPQPQGVAGGKHSLMTAARLASKYRDEVNVRAWVTHLLNEEGLTGMDLSEEATLARIITIARWVQNEVAWVPDPKGREYIPAPYLLLPCRDGQCSRLQLPTLAGDDCDGKLTLVLALLMAALLNVDVSVVAVGHGYAAGVPGITHVLAAVVVGGKHYYIDPSLNLPFGECLPFQHEVLISVPDLRVLCDSPRCLGGSNMSSITAGIEGPQNVDTMQVVSGARAPANAVGAREATEEERATLGQQLAFDLDLLKESKSELLSVIGVADRIAAEAGIVSVEGIDRQRMTDLLRASDLLVQYMNDVLAQRRRLLLHPNGEWEIEALDTDQVVLRSDGTAFWIEERATGTRVTPNLTAGAPNAAGALPAILKSLPQPLIVVIGLAPILIGIAGSLTVAWLIYRAIEASKVVVLKALENQAIKHLNVCLEASTPEECAKYQKAIGEARAAALRAETEKIRAKNEPTLAAISTAGQIVLVGSIAAAAIGGYKLWTELGRPGVSRRRKAALWRSRRRRGRFSGSVPWAFMGRTSSSSTRRGRRTPVRIRGTKTTISAARARRCFSRRTGSSSPWTRRTRLRSLS